MSQPIDLLAIAAHPDDAEITCGGTLARAAEQGYRTGILNLTLGEMATRGTPEMRAEESARAAQVLGVVALENAGLRDAHLENSEKARKTVVDFLRKLTPRTVILPYERGNHPDHRIASQLSRDACFLAGLKEYNGGPATRPFKVLYTLSYREDPVKPTFVVPITETQFEQKIAAVRCYASQFENSVSAGEVFPTGQPLIERIETQMRYYGSLIREPFGEPFYTEETVSIPDVIDLPVQSM